MREPPLLVSTVDYHTAGEPFRIVSGGAPPLRGRTVLEKRRFAAERLDHVRKLLVNEPRGHADMYGCFVVEGDDAGADLGVVFFHNAGYSTACGHGTIALVTWALETGQLPAVEPETAVTVDVPSGRLPCVARVERGHVRSVRFRNVPCYVHARAVEVETSAGRLAVDIGFGGAFYAYLDAAAAGLAVEPAHLPDLIRVGREIKHALEAAHDVVHPLEPELRDIYGVWLSQPEPGGGERNVTVFADGEVDRSPCGSATSARLAVLGLAPGETFRSVSIVGTEFAARAVERAEVAGRPALVAEVEGSAFRTGVHHFTLDPADPVGLGFVLR